MINYRLPKSWEDLERKVAQILSEAGLKTIVEKDISAARGFTNVDVFAIDENQSPKVTYICECKYWKRKVSMDAVKSLRTTVVDYGANYGIIISKNGFQQGAVEWVNKTNICLVDWFEFQEMFEDKWWKNICAKLYAEFDTLINYADVTPLEFRTKKWKRIENDETKCAKFAWLLKEYQEIGYDLMGLGMEGFGGLSKKPTFPITMKIPDPQTSRKTIQIDSLRDYVDFLVFHGQRGLKAFAELFGEAV